MLASLSIHGKIMLAFAMMLAIVAGLGSLSLLCAGATNNPAQGMVSNYYQSLERLDRMRAEAQRTRVFLNRGVWSDKAGLAPLEAEINAATKAFAADDEKYLPTIAGPEEARLHGRIAAASGRLFFQAGVVLAALHDGRVDAAKHLMLADVAPTAEALDGALLADYKLISDGATAQAAHAAASYGFGRIIVGGLLIATAAFAVVCGLFLVISFARPIAAITVSMGRLAARDLTSNIPNLGRGDEVGRFVAKQRAA